MNEHEDLTRRLGDLGRHPVDPATASSHLTAMVSVPATTPRRFGRLAVAAAALAGFVVGGSGLAVAGAVPQPVEDAVNKVMEVTGFRNRGECVSQAAKSGDAAAKDACPKGKANPPDGERGRSAGAKARLEEKKNDGDPCAGPPAWAGRGQPTLGEKEAHRSAKAACPAEAGDAGDDAAEGQAEAEGQAGVTAEPAPPPADTPPEPPVADPPPEPPVADAPAADSGIPDGDGGAGPEAGAETEPPPPTEPEPETEPETGS